MTCDANETTYVFAFGILTHILSFLIHFIYLLNLLHLYATPLTGDSGQPTNITTNRH